MKQVLISIICCFAIFACNKSDISTATFDGNWKMVSVKENVSGLVSTKPSSLKGDVVITFTSATATNGTFSGHTTVNDFIGGYTTGENQTLSINSFSMTKVGENSWGEDFIDNFRNAKRYHFETTKKLYIISSEKTLTFQKQ